MKATHITTSLLVGVAVLAGCTERSATTAPLATAAALSASGFIGDRPYTWSFTCHGGWVIYAFWYWTENGTTIASGSSSCAAEQSLSGTSVRPANANGFTAQVGTTSNSWTFDPAGSFKASLSGSVGDGHCFSGICFHKEGGKLTVDS